MEGVILMEELENSLQESFIDFAHDHPQAALTLITGLFVGLLEHTVKQQGEDHKKEITIDGGEFRGITLHPINI